MLTITRRTHGDAMIIDLEGQIDGSSESEDVLTTIRDCLGQKPSRILLNLERVKWINSLGVGYLVAAFASARNQGTSLRLFGVPSRVAAVLQTCGISPNVIGVFANEEAALRARD